MYRSCRHTGRGSSSPAGHDPARGSTHRCSGRWVGKLAKRGGLMNSTVTANGSHSEPRRACALPRIGLLTARGCLREGNWPVYAGDAATIHAIFEAGGSPIIIPTLPIVLGDYDPFGVLTDEDAFDDVFSVLWPTICSLDGLVLAGGGDVYSCFYGQVMHPQAGPPDLWRDLWERYFALAAWRLQMPTLGICRGMHVMNMVRGGGLVQDIRVAWPKTMPPLLRHQAKGRSSASHCAEHPLTIHPKSRLARLLH